MIEVEVIGGCRDGLSIWFSEPYEIPNMLFLDLPPIPLTQALDGGLYFTAQSDYADCYYFCPRYHGKPVFLVDLLHDHHSQ